MATDPIVTSEMSDAGGELISERFAYGESPVSWDGLAKEVYIAMARAKDPPNNNCYEFPGRRGLML